MKKYLLLIIDSQLGIDQENHWGGNRNNPEAEENISALLGRFRALKLPVIHVCHRSKDAASPFWPEKEGFRFKPSNMPMAHEPVVEKSEPNAFIGTDLEIKIKETGADEIVVAGFVTNNSVESTARMAGGCGFPTIVISDATATFDKTGIYGEKYASDLVHRLSLANLSQEYAAIVSTEQLLARLE